MPRPQMNKDKLIEVSTHLFATKGFDGTSIRDIAAAMDMSISNIYHYFGSKEGLLFAILEHYSSVLLTELRRVVALDLPPLKRFRLLVETHIRLAGTHTRETKIFFLDDERLSPEGRRANRRNQRQVLDIFLAELARLEKQGLLRDGDRHLLAFNIFGIINWQMRWFRPDGPISLDEVVRRTIDFVFFGLMGLAPKGLAKEFVQQP